MFDAREFLYLVVALLFSLSFHEASHAYMADRLGDPTARYMGRLTLNPIAHLDLFGTLFMMLALLSGIGIGWAKPVPFNPNNLRGSYRSGIGMVAIAGPGANLVLAIAGAMIARLLSIVNVPVTITMFFVYLVVVNVSLLLFNLIPLPPLDGSKVLVGLLGRFRGQWAYTAGNQLLDLERYGMMPLFALLVLNSFVPVLSVPLGFVSNLIVRILLA